jgi:hypothetical protein
VDFRGFEVSLKKIEGALMTCPGVKDAVVKTKRDPVVSIVAYVVGDDEHKLTMRFLHDHLARVRPGYVQPSQAFLVDDIGCVEGGVALPDTRSDEDPHIAEVLSALWAAELGRESVDIHQSYWQAFSFLRAAARAVQLGIPLTPQALMRGRTVEQLANVVTCYPPPPPDKVV